MCKIALEIFAEHVFSEISDATFMWQVKARWKPGRMKAVVDPKLHETYNPKAMRAVLTLALKCIEEQGRNRPDMRTVVGELRAATELEYKTVKASKWNLKSLIII